jgi:adenylate cyclase
LPPAVSDAIAEDQRLSEIVVCIAQFAAIAFFGFFYALTPKGFHESVSFEPVPWALGAYGLFTALRFQLALRNRLSPVFLSLSVVVDISVLMLTIWSFHLQYEEPATIYLKAPTLLYVFILIALRTLRFEAVYVVLAGASAIIGWLTLVGYAVMQGGEVKITNSFTEYMTSQSILIGAEVDKLISIGGFTLVLTIAMVRARRLMIRSASEAYAANALSKFFEPTVAREIRSAKIGLLPGQAIKRDAAVMFLDLRDFTGLSTRLQPDETVALLRGFHQRTVPAVQNNGGSVDKYLGDGILVTFGAAMPNDTYAADALRTVGDILTSIEAWNEERARAGQEQIGIGVGVTAGEILVGVTGEESRLEYTVLGEVVNLAAKIEKQCKIVGRPALVTRETLETAVRQGFTGEALFDRLAPQQVVGTDRMHALAAIGDAALSLPSGQLGVK